VKLTKLSMRDRRRRRLGDAVEYVLQHDHMGAVVDGSIATVYLGPSQVMELWDLLDAAASVNRQSVSEVLWGDVMATVERLHGEYADLMAEPGLPTRRDQELVQWGEARGRAQGLAFALALLANPRHPDIEAVRAESVRRWEAAEDGAAGS
jgi:hypothetical protein